MSARLSLALVTSAWLTSLACSGTEAPGSHAASVATEAAEAAESADPADPCPLLTASANSDQAGGVAPSVAGEDVVTDLDAIAAALPESVGQLARSEVTSWPRGAAGHWSPVVLAFYEDASSRVGVEVNDLVHVCSCESGMGETLQAREVASGLVATQIAARPAVRISGPSPELKVWVSDRCSIRVWAGPAEVLDEVAGAIDWAALSAACSARR